MSEKKILIFLDKLKNINSGLGQVSMAYGLELAKQYKIKYPHLKFTYLVPKEFVGFFGEGVEYMQDTLPNRLKIKYTKRYDLLHYLHQDIKTFLHNSQTSYIVTIHDLNYLFVKSKRKIKKYHSRLQKNVQSAKALFCISNFTKDCVIRNLDFGNIPIHTIYNGVQDFSCLKQDIPKDFPKNTPFLLAVGYIDYKKNFLKLIDILQPMSGTRLVIVGSGSKTYEHMMKTKIAQLNIGDRVTLVGKVSQANLSWFYHHCQMYLSVSLAEGFGLPVLEAMSVGKPVMLSKSTSYEEIGGKEAFFWKTSSSLSMAKELGEVLETLPLQPNQVQKKKEYAATFSWEKNVEAMLKHYNEIA